MDMLTISSAEILLFILNSSKDLIEYFIIWYIGITTDVWSRVNVKFIPPSYLEIKIPPNTKTTNNMEKLIISNLILSLVDINR